MYVDVYVSLYVRIYRARKQGDGVYKGGPKETTHNSSQYEKIDE